MKRLPILSLVCLAVLLGGCTREVQPSAGGEVGPETWVTIPFACSGFDPVQIATRSDIGIIAESRVKNIFLFIFKSDGTRLYAHFFDSGNLGSRTDIMAGRADGWWVTNTTDKTDPYGAYTLDSPDDSKWTNGGIRVRAPQYTGGKVYAIANIDGDMINISPESLNLIRTEADLLALTAHLQPRNQTLQRNGYFPMTGHKSPVKIVGANSKMQYSGGSGYTDAWYLELQRMDAKVRFNIQVGIGSSSYPGTGTEAEYKELMSFKPESWQVVNVPKGCSVFETAAASGDTAGAETEGYFDSEPMPTETVTDEETDHPAYGFTFYMMENRESARKNGSVSGGTAAERYHKRDLRKKDAAGAYLLESGNMWEYAPERGTYVIIKGTLNMEVIVSSEAKDQNLCADVTYVVHLGDFATSADDYDVLRNTYYTYTVHILGVDKIVLEVTTSQPSSSTPFTEAHSGAMGSVNIAKESTYTFDCHYGQRVFCFDADHIDPTHCFWYVKTPYGKEGIPPRVGDSDVPSGFDYKWVHFMVNPVDDDTSSETYTRYGSFPYQHVNQPYPGDDSPRLMDVVQLTSYLREQKVAYSAGEPNDFLAEYDQEWADWATRTPDMASGVSGGGLSDPDDIAAVAKRHRIYVTAYIDEFYYEEHPITHESPQDFWKTFVNQPNRMMFLLCDSYFSLDKASSATGSVITIRQRSIQTPYNLKRDALQSAWGTEVVDETEGLVWFYSQKEHVYPRGKNATNFASEINPYVQLPVNSRFNGRYNTASNWLMLSGSTWTGGHLWSDHLDFHAENDANYVFLKDDPDVHDDATMRWACLMRNRDNDGDGTIDPEEIRWYMASSEQIIDLFLGGQGLSDEAMTYSQAWADREGVYPAGDEFAGADRWRLHYISSTINKNSRIGGKQLPDMIRAEEGPNIGNGYYHMDAYWDNAHKQGRFTMRCVRNLGLDAEQLNPATAATVIADASSIPTPMVLATPSKSTFDRETQYVFDCQNINEKSLRYFSSVELEPESEFGQSARLWKKFETGPWVSMSDVFGTSAAGTNYKNIQAWLLRGDSPCPEGYRVPNIREAAVMMMFTENAWWKNSCASTNVCNWIYCGPSTGNAAVGGNGKDVASVGNTEANKNSWGVLGSDGNITLGSTSPYIRCVRDLPI